MNKTIYTTVAIILLTIIIGVVIMLNRNNKETTSKITYSSMDEIQEIMNQNTNYIILDVRTIEEYSEGHIPNAICIPNEIIDEAITTKLPNKDNLILIYCRSGNRSKQAAHKLLQLGYANLVEFGGIIDWEGKIEK